MFHRQLKPCPDKPNCVCSLSDESRNSVEPLRYVGDWQAAKKSLINLIENTPRTVIFENDLDYIHAGFSSRIFGFVDDVEFVFDDTQKLIHIRSASRIGYYDFGVNRRRVEKLRKDFAGTGKET